MSILIMMLSLIGCIFSIAYDYSILGVISGIVFVVSVFIAGD